LPALYIHIPFCRQKCLYCDFCSVTTVEALDNFLPALACEIALRGDQGSETYDTVFFGGGTPSLLTPRQLETILGHVHRTFRIAPAAEVTLEANPGTVTRETLVAFRALGINRLSVGVQSFHDRELTFLGRIHDSAEARRCLTDARNAGFENIAVDLIYSIPGQTLPAWEASLRMGTGLDPQHIAAYSLIIETHTPLARAVRAGVVHPTPTALEAAMYECAMETLANGGYEHYEVSNYARPGFRCRHNGAYWSHDDYLGLGPSAHSFRKSADGRSGTRCWNTSDLSLYCERLQRGVVPIAGEERLGPRDLLHERILLGLRGQGLDLARLRAALGDDGEAQPAILIRELIEAGLAVREAGLLRLTPQGFVLCDEICARLARVVPRPSVSPPSD
jgi:oxygen-independent coproporphyrinogen-3 oxidase